MDSSSQYGVEQDVQDDDNRSANTEDRLISVRNSSESITSSNDSNKCCDIEKDNTICCGPIYKLVFGIILIVFGITSLIWSPFDVLMQERLKMIPGLPPYDWWETPPDEVLLRVYVFNVTNSESFLNGTSKKLHLQEIGPIIYREKLIHSDVVFNDNDTLTYKATRTAIYLPEMNSINLNQTIIVPNFALLGMASFLWDSTFFTKFGFNVLLRNLKSEPIVNTTIYNYLWNLSDPLLKVGKNVLPSLVPVSNMGMLHRIYSDFVDVVTVYIGSNNGNDKFFTIDKYDGSEQLPGQTKCNDKVVGATEGVAYPQFLTKNSTLLYWRKTLCMVTPLVYNSEVQKYGITAYRFVLPESTYYRKFPKHSDCYIGIPELPNGLSDVSKCYFDFPMAASFPHFLYGDEVINTYVDGLDPNESKHGSFVTVEPFTGIPMESRARSQSNLVVHKLSGFGSNLDKFSNIMIPMFWAEYNQVGLPWYISFLIYFTVVLMPIAQKVAIAVAFVLGAVLVALSFKQKMARRRQHLMKNKRAVFEQEVFIKPK